MTALDAQVAACRSADRARLEAQGGQFPTGLHAKLLLSISLAGAAQAARHQRAGTLRRDSNPTGAYVPGDQL